MQAKFWTPVDDIASSGYPIFFRAADQPAAIASLQASEFFPPAYAVLPNGEGLVDFIGPYVKLARRVSPGTIALADYSGSSTPVADILGCCLRICDGFADLAADAAISACTDLSSLLAGLPVAKLPSIPPKLGAAAEFLREFASECLKPLEYGTPFVHMGTAPQHKSWWKVRPLHLTPLAQLRAKRATVFPGRPNALQSVERWIDLVAARLVRMHAFPPMPSQRQEAVLEASAYCGAIAERHLMRSHFGQAILHLHRAVDLLLFAICDRHTLINHVYQGGQYVPGVLPATAKTTKVTLLNSYSVLLNYLAPDPNRQGDFEILNDWRNLLMQAHYMTGLDDTTARGVFGLIRPHLQKLGGSSWQTAQSEYLQGVSLTIADLLDVDQSLSSTVQQVSY
jgi:hypothetical protein